MKGRLAFALLVAPLLGAGAARADRPPHSAPPVSPLWDDVLHPNRIECATLLDQAKEQNRELAQASDRILALLTRAARLCPGSFETNSRLGAALFEAGRLPESRRFLERARAIEPAGEDRDPQFAFRLAFVRAVSGDLAGSLTEYRRALASGGLGAEEGWLVHYDLGDSLMALGRLSEAISSYQRAAQAAPNEPMVHLALAVALDRDGEPEGARREAAIYLRLDPKERAFTGSDYVFVPAADGHYYRALVALGAGRLVEARRELQAFLAALPNGPYAASARAHLARLRP